MAKVLARITMSIDGYITGPNDGPGRGLGDGGERLHYWVFGGPWTYADGERRGPTGEDAAWLAEVTSRIGGGRWWTLDVRGGAALGRQEPVGIAVLHRHAPPGGGAGWWAFTFVSGVEAAVELKRLFDGFSQSLDLEHVGVRQSPFATFIDYRVKPL
ncbi:MAG: hypothetical protein ABSG95_15995 [Solirubrobacteraceae bacterium]|jgi:hypothetical protein